VNDELIGIFREAGVLREGHFLLASGLHSPVYWEKFRILQYPHHTSTLCGLIAEHFKDERIDVIAGPTTGGIILAFETARQMGVRSIFAEKEGTTRVFRRDFEVAHGERVLLVDDILTTGGSIRDTMTAVGTLGGVIVGIGVLVDRSQEQVDLGVAVFSCLRAPGIAYTPEECPLCAAHVPLTKPGGIA